MQVTLSACNAWHSAPAPIRAKKTAEDLLAGPPHIGGWRSSLKLVAQLELHHTRVGEQARVPAKGGSLIEFERGTLDVEPLDIGNVEHAPAEAQVVRVPVGHLPLLAERHIPSEIAIAPDGIAHARLTRERRGKALNGRLRVREQVPVARNDRATGLDRLTRQNSPA